MNAEYIWELWEEIKRSRPLVHCITNMVTVNDCANILLAAGASPTMAHHSLEVEEVTAGCKSLVCNMGAMEYLDAMETAGKKALTLGHPIVLDPVGAAGASFRRNSCLNLIKEIHPTCIRGNYSEIRALYLEQKTGMGVDVQEKDRKKEHALEDAAQAAKNLAARLQCCVTASGIKDIISDGKQVIIVHNGSEMMSRVTGMGCMSSAMLGAFLSVENSLESAAACCVVMGICGEIAEEETRRLGAGIGTFHIKFLDAVSLLTKEQIAQRVINCKEE